MPTTTVTITDPELVLKINKLIDALEDCDDVQNVFHDADLPRRGRGGLTCNRPHGSQFAWSRFRENL